MAICTTCNIEIPEEAQEKVSCPNCAKEGKQEQAPHLEEGTEEDTNSKEEND